MKYIPNKMCDLTTLLDVIRQGCSSQVQISVSGSQVVIRLNTGWSMDKNRGAEPERTKLNGFEGVKGSVDAAFRTVKLSTRMSISPVEP